MLKIYNTLTRKEEIFKPLKSPVTMYTCGPTVYNYAHIGNLRTNLLYDLIKRSLVFLNYKVNHVMNITDVDDKTIRGSKKEGISLKEFTRKYEEIFLNDLKELNIIKPTHIPRATEHIKEMVDLIKNLLEKKIAYKASDGIYFDISKAENYGSLIGLEKIKKTKARVKNDEYDKENPQDFALWKFYTPEDGNVFWDTEIGKGRPGWHIECSAMSIKYLGKTIDIHSGATDLCFPHHSNEIAQSEAATGKKFVNYWLHGGFLTMKEGKMSKSLGNILRLKDIKEKGFSPLDFRYLCLLTHYRKPLSFDLDNLDAAKKAHDRLKRKIIELKENYSSSKSTSEKYEKLFIQAINDDLNIPEAVQVLWKVLDDNALDINTKLNLAEKFDKVFGLGFKEMHEIEISIPSEIKKLIDKREQARKNKDWKESDKIRNLIEQKGYKIQDTQEGIKIEKFS